MALWHYAGVCTMTAPLRMLFVAMILALAEGMCLDEDGFAVDWFMALKQPDGTHYVYLDDHSQEFRQSDHSLDAGSHGAIENTINQVYQSQLENFAFYNDASPDGANHESRAHMKGALGFSSETLAGFWLVHSVPAFPPKRVDGYWFPDNAIRYGQSFLCVSIQGAETLNIIGTQWSVDFPHIHDSHLSEKAVNLVANFSNALAGFHVRVPAARALTMNTVAGQEVTLFAKNKQWDSDLYERLVSPHFQTGLDVETWQNGVGKMESFCVNTTVAYDSLNVDVLTVGNISFSSTKDHSKWAIGQVEDVVCIGDINRQYSMRDRGGGTVCIRDKKVHKAFQQVIQQLEAC